MTAWSSSSRAQRLPLDWKQRRDAVAARAGWRCQAVDADGVRCVNAGSECDHVVAGDNHELSNLQWLCSWHHKRKTSREAAEAMRARRARADREWRAPHPGYR